ncbi:MAG: hypothetical protein QOC64_2763, partial [Solirubrobacteraceae bacterium]|nr:hypothetical protein [Solirubrobacteraceae bacterium]
MASPKAPGDRTGGARSAGAAGRARAAVARRSRVLAAALAAFALPAATAEAADPTPVQAVDANAEFLAWAPPPATPVKVCVVDTGVDLTTDVAGRVVRRYSMYGGTLDDVGGGGIPKHGTWVAGVIASGRDDGGSVGIWPQAQIVSVRVFPDANSGSSVPAYVLALETCRLEGATVANLSLSGLGQATGADLAQLENKIVDLRTNWRINVVAAAGNSNGGAVGYPAAFPSVLAVGASDTAAAFCDLSARGPEIDLSTLGCGVELSLPGGQRAVGRGTSYAAPVVSSVLAALRAYKPSLTVAEAERLLLDTATPGGAGRRLDAAAAFRAAGLTSYVTSSDPLAVQAAPAAPTGGVEPNTAPIAANGGPR